MVSINNNIYPKEGFFFKERDGASIRGDTWEGVIVRVTNYRRRAGYPEGNVREEVMTQACQRNPGLCIEEDGAYRAALNKATLKTRVLKWFLDTFSRHQREPFTFSYETDANNRAQVCATCPKNQQMPGGCASCKAAVEESRKNIIGGRFVDARLHACDVLGEDLNTARWIEQIVVENGDLPGFCWRKKTL